MLALAAVLGAVVASLVRTKRKERVVKKEVFLGDAWLNTTIRTVWKLFRRNTGSLTENVIQPVLDAMEFEDPVAAVNIHRLELGKSPPLITNIQKLPSRSLSEIQYRFSIRLIGDANGIINLKVPLEIPPFGTRLTVPIVLNNLDIDATVWIGFTVVPYPPWVRFVQWALFTMPVVKFDVSVTPYIPITSIPILSTILDNILTKQLPRQFLFPKTQIIDLMGEEQDVDITLEQGLLQSQSIDISIQQMSIPELQRLYPKLSALFDAIDLDDDGILSATELSDGLVDWAFASTADRHAIINLLDVNNDGYVQFREFIVVWPDLQNLFVPRRFRGVLSGVLLRAEGLRTPFFGSTDPYVILQVESQAYTSKRNKATSKSGQEKGNAFWNQGWELYVQQPKTGMLRIEVREGSYLSYYPDYITPPPLPATHSGSSLNTSLTKKANRIDTIIGYGIIPISELTSKASSMWVDLTTGGGRIRLDIQYNQFVDPKLV